MDDYSYSSINTSQFQLYKEMATENPNRCAVQFDDSLDQIKWTKKYSCEVRLFNESVQIYNFNVSFVLCNFINFYPKIFIEKIQRI